MSDGIPVPGSEAGPAGMGAVLHPAAAPVGQQPEYTDMGAGFPVSDARTGGCVCSTNGAEDLSSVLSVLHLSGFLRQPLTARFSCSGNILYYTSEKVEAQWQMENLPEIWQNAQTDGPLVVQSAAWRTAAWLHTGGTGSPVLPRRTLPVPRMPLAGGQRCHPPPGRSGEGLRPLLHSRLRRAAGKNGNFTDDGCGRRRGSPQVHMGCALQRGGTGGAEPPVRRERERRGWKNRDGSSGQLFCQPKGMVFFQLRQSPDLFHPGEEIPDAETSPL